MTLDRRFINLIKSVILPVLVGSHREEVRIMDDDLDRMDREALVAEVKRLRAGVRKHRDSSGHELCWHHPDLWSLLPESAAALPSVPAWPQFLRGCIKYRESLDRQLPHAERTEEELQALTPLLIEWAKEPRQD